MAYRTNWKLDAQYICGERKELTSLDKREVEEYIQDNEDMRWVFGDELGEWGEDDRSFTDSDRNMSKLSRIFPQMLFTLKYERVEDTCEGIYTEYWLNGEVQIEQLQYFTPEFNISKLKEYC